MRQTNKIPNVKFQISNKSQSSKFKTRVLGIISSRACIEVVLGDCVILDLPFVTGPDQYPVSALYPSGRIERHSSRGSFAADRFSEPVVSCRFGEGETRPHRV